MIASDTTVSVVLKETSDIEIKIVDRIERVNDIIAKSFLLKANMDGLNLNSNSIISNIKKVSFHTPVNLVIYMIY